MASFYAEITVDGHTYLIRQCTYSFSQATDNRGRVVTKVRHGHVQLTLDVPREEILLNWAAIAHKTLAGHITFFAADRRTVLEAVSWEIGYCVGYREEFISGDDTDGAYVCHLTIAAPQLEMHAGRPSAYTPPTPREHGQPVAPLAPVVPVQVATVSLTQKPALFRDNTWGVEPAPPELIQKVMDRRRVIVALPGSDDLAYLNNPLVMAEASCNDHDYQHIIIRENPSKAALLEEFLHGTQQRLGIIKELGRGGAEYHVKDFMIRHKRLLGLGTEDVEILQELMNAGL